MKTPASNCELQIANCGTGISPSPVRLCRSTVHGSRASPRTVYAGSEVKYLTVRPELVEGLRADYDTVSVSGEPVLSLSKEGRGEGLCEPPIQIDRRKRLVSKLLWTCLFSVLGLIANPEVGLPQNGPQVGQKPAPAVGAAAINFELKSLDGKAVSLETFRGKPLAMNFFASWCDPCREEMPLLNQLASKANKEGYAILGIAVEDTRAAVTQYIDEAKIGFPVALDLNSTVKRAYRIFGPPATFFIDGKGIIRDMVIGPVTAERAREGLRKAGASR